MNNINYDLGIIIPVKAISTRVPNKNALPFGNQPTLLEWKISQLIQIAPKDIIYVSTESEPFKEIARKWGVKIHDRDPILCDDIKSGFSHILSSIIKDIPHQHIAWATVTNPLMTPNEYKICFAEYKKHIIDEKTNDSLIPVNLLKEYLWDDNNSLNYNAGEGHVISQNLPNWYRITNALYMLPQELALEYKYFIGKNPYKVQVSKLAGIDIDYPEDYDIAKALYSLY